MNPQPRSQMIESMAALALAAAAWMITVSSHAAKPSEASIASDRDDGEDGADGGLAPEEEKVSGKDKSHSRAPAKAEPIIYEVQPGDSLSEIAEAHGVRVTDILDANEIANPDHVETGTKLRIPGTESQPAQKPAVEAKKKGPEGVRITVPKGVTLKRIADVYGIPWKRIAKANKLGATGRVRFGQKLFIPGATEVREIVPCRKAPVELYRVQTDETTRVSLCRCNGEADAKGLEALSEFAGPLKKPVPFQLDARVAELLQKVANAYPGRRLEIVSGQRSVKPNQKNESFHNKGRAIDFRVAGVPNRKLVEKVRSFEAGGVGYYPNSVFIHMDARDKPAYWVDYSRPGEKAIYGRAGMTNEEVEKIRLARRTAATETTPDEAAPQDVEAETDVGALADAPPAAPSATAEAALAEAPSPVAVNVPAAP